MPGAPYPGTVRGDEWFTFDCLAAAALDTATSCRSDRFRTDQVGTVDPLKGEHLSPSDVPLMNDTSNTISSHVSRLVWVRPTTVPLEAIGTLPESAV